MKREIRFTQARQGTPVSVQRSAGGDSIQGYAAVFYNGTKGTEYELWAGAVERIMPGAFDRAVSERDDAAALFNHDRNYVLGRVGAGTCQLSIDGKGLRYSITPAKHTVYAYVLEAVQRGDVSGSSFAFTVEDERWVKEKGIDVREVRGVRLFDVSPVLWPAYVGTSAGTRIDGDDPEKTIRDTINSTLAGRLAALRIRARAVEVMELEGA